MTSKPGVALQDVLVEEGPYIVQRGKHFYLRYRLAAGPEDRLAVRVAAGPAERPVARAGAGGEPPGRLKPRGMTGMFSRTMR